MSSEKNKINKNDLANGKANGEQNCDETSEAKPCTATIIIEDSEAKTEAGQADQDGEEAVKAKDERVLPKIDDPNNER